MGGRKLGHSCAQFNSSIFFVQKVWIEIQAHTNCFSVLCNCVELDFMACACTSPPVWLGTNKFAYFQVNLIPGWRLFRANIAGCDRRCWPAYLSQRILCWPRRRNLVSISLCQLNSNQPPFKSLPPGCYSIGQECVATLPSQRPSSLQRASALKRSMLMCWLNSSWQGRGKISAFL